MDWISDYITLHYESKKKANDLVVKFNPQQ